MWEIAVPNGTYAVHVVVGDPQYADVVSKLTIEGVLTINGATALLNMNGHNLGSAATPLSTFTFGSGTLTDLGTCFGGTMECANSLPAGKFARTQQSSTGDIGR